MTRLLEGRGALVTGGASGIGRATALALAREGARVLICDVDEEGGARVAAEIEQAGGEARFHAADVTSETEVEAAVSRAVECWRSLDCAVNNAGITGAPGNLPDVPLDGWRQTLETNLTSVFLCLKHELRVMQKQGRGAIVNVASGAGLVAVPGLSPYSASKHAVLGLTKTAAVENARTGVRINAVCPGTIDTPMLRSAMDGNASLEELILSASAPGRLGEAAEVAEAILFLCSDRASFVSGESMLVDGATVAR